jgi:cell division protein FtsI/penicillin-binding protein 2
MCIACLGAVSWRLFDVAYLRHQGYSQAAQAQANGSTVLPRGNIYLHDGAGQEFLVATNRKFPFVRTAGRIRRLTDEQVDAIKVASPSTVIAYQADRSYPAGMLAADVLGFLGYDQDGRHGQYGVEAAYESELSGRQAGDHPDDVILTLDKNIQAYAQNELDAVLKKYNAASGVLLVQEPATGRLLAMADSPSFDPNTYASTPTQAFLNGGLVPFEPGSSFKPFTMAMGLDLGKITPATTFSDVNDIVVDGYTIKNFNEKHFGRVTMTQVLEKSINAGTMYVQSLLTTDQFLTYIINEGFGQRTGLDLPGEASGDIGNLYSGRRINFMTASFGQGITVTPIQLINAYSAIANGGKLMRPYVVAAVRDEHGTVTRTEPEVIGTPFTARTAATLRQMLVSVVDNGFDKARIPRYDIAGKTGTAQIADPTKGGYLEGRYNHSFVGFAPASNPKFVILIKMERPQGITFAADSLSPVFKDMSLFLLNYLNIPPSR